MKNTTQYPFEVVSSSGVITLAPGESRALTFGLHEVTSFRSATVSGTKLSFTSKPASEFDTLYVTEGGLGSQAGQTIGGNAVVIGQKWHVVQPKDPQTVLAEKVIRVMPSTITFDGKSLSVQ